MGSRTFAVLISIITLSACVSNGDRRPVEGTGETEIGVSKDSANTPGQRPHPDWNFGDFYVAVTVSGENLGDIQDSRCAMPSDAMDSIYSILKNLGGISKADTLIVTLELLNEQTSIVKVPVLVMSYDDADGLDCSIKGPAVTTPGSHVQLTPYFVVDNKLELNARINFYAVTSSNTAVFERITSLAADVASKSPSGAVSVAIGKDLAKEISRDLDFAISASGSRKLDNELNHPFHVSSYGSDNFKNGLRVNLGKYVSEDVASAHLLIGLDFRKSLLYPPGETVYSSDPDTNLSFIDGYASSATGQRVTFSQVLQAGRVPHFAPQLLKDMRDTGHKKAVLNACSNLDRYLESNLSLTTNDKRVVKGSAMKAHTSYFDYIGFWDPVCLSGRDFMPLPNTQPQTDIAHLARIFRIYPKDYDSDELYKRKIGETIDFIVTAGRNAINENAEGIGIADDFRVELASSTVLPASLFSGVQNYLEPAFFQGYLTAEGLPQVPIVLEGMEGRRFLRYLAQGKGFCATVNPSRNDPTSVNELMYVSRLMYLDAEGHEYHVGASPDEQELAPLVGVYARIENAGDSKRLKMLQVSTFNGVRATGGGASQWPLDSGTDSCGMIRPGRLADISQPEVSTADGSP